MPTLVVLGVLAIIYFIFVSFWTNRLWFQAIDYSEVFTTQLLTRGLLFVTFGLLMAAAVVANAWVAYRLRPLAPPMSAEQQSLERYRQSIEPVRVWVLAVAGGLLGIIAGSSASSQWQAFLAWRNGGSFGQKDPEFGVDLGFYAFDYPWWRYVLSFGFAMVVLSIIVAAVTHYIFGNIRLQTPGDRVSTGAQAHLSLLVGLFVLLKAVAYFLDRYGLLIQDNSVGGSPFTGATFADVNAQLPAKQILMIVALICALILFVNVWRRNWMLPGIGLGLLVLSAVLLSGLWPFIVQQFQVSPTEEDRERDYIALNIEGTRSAYGIDGVEIQDYAATLTTTPGQLADDAGTVPGVRLMDPNVIQPAFQQLQQVRGFYSFEDPLDVDRYEIDGADADVVVSAREMDVTEAPQQNWVNQHTVYTHGFGLVAAYGNQRQPDGSPSFAERDIPSSGILGEYEPRVYYGEESPDYSVVGAPEGSRDVEFDVPEDPETGDQRLYTYQGEGGVSLGSFFNKLLYATRFQEANILLSDRVNEDSVILYDRDPRERVEKVAPWLTVDGNPYPSVVDGEMVWIVDGYTTLNSLPYAQRVSLEEATETSSTAVSTAVAAQPQDHVNYINNSVKATVDAYDGTVTLYAWDETDPVLQTWMGAFPDSVTPRSEMSDDLLDHVRYPEDLFKVQRKMLERYHVTEPTKFYTGDDAWEIPNDPTAGDLQIAQPPYYQTIQMPDEDTGVFSLTSTYVPRNRANLAAFMAVKADSRVDEYGQLTILRLPGNRQINGPEQVANEFESNTEVANELTQLRLGDAQTVTGNLLTLPVGGGLLYVQPVYVERETGTTFPLLRRVLVQFGDEIGFDSTLEGALDQVFGGESGADTDEGAPIEDDLPPGDEEGDEPPPDDGEPTDEPTEEASPPVDEPPSDASEFEEAAAEVGRLWTLHREAEAEGRYEDAGRIKEQLDDAIARLDELLGEN